jgi:thiol-disulfide isomerase/thioredoxin
MFRRIGTAVLAAAAIATAGFAAFGSGNSQAFATAALQPGASAPNFTGIDTWLNSAPLDLTQLRGKVVLVDFWTFDCINCAHTLPHVKDWYARYRDKGLVVVGVHTPEYAFEHDTANVRRAIRRYGIDYPVAQDNQYATWKAYGNEYWPAVYLIDQNGKLVYSHYGEGSYAQTEQAIRSLLGLANKAG